MSESNHSRRKLLKSIAAGSGAVVIGKSLPDSWSKPVVDSVVLPVHAQTSPCTPCLVAALYCEGSGSGITVDVAIDGTLTVTHQRITPQTDTVDPCTGGAFSVTGDHITGGGSTTIAGTISCGVQTSIEVTENGGTPITLTTAICPPP